MSDIAKGVALTLLGVVFLSPEAVLVRLANLELWPLLFWRGIFAFIGLVVLIALREGRRTPAAFGALGRLGVLLIFLELLSIVLMVASLLTTSAANTLITLATAPIFSAIFSRAFLGEPIGTRTLAAIGGCFFGILLIVSGSLESASLAGDILGLLNAAAWGGVLTVMRATPETNWLPGFSLAFLASAVIAAGLAPTIALPGPSAPFVLAIGIVVYPGAFAFLQIAPRFLSAPDIGLLLLLETVLGPLLAWWFVGEVPGRHSMLGGAIVISSLVLHSVAGLREEREAAGVCQNVS